MENYFQEIESKKVSNESEESNDSSNFARHRCKTTLLAESRTFVILRYVTMSTLALLLTLSCLAVHDKQEVGEVLLAYILTVASFLSVQCSDPGFLSVDVLSNFQPGEHGLLLPPADGELTEGESYNDAIFQNKKKEAIKNPLQQTNSTRSTSSPEKMNPSLVNTRFSSSSSTMRAATLANHNDNNELANKSNPPNHDDDEFYRGKCRKFCDVCNFAPPIRSHHCRKCQRCIATFDHHCGLAGKCIGERNHCRFWWFLLIQALSFLRLCFVVGSSRTGGWMALLLKGFQWGSLLVEMTKTFYLYPLTFAAVSMLVVHSFFAVSNSTMFECTFGPQHVDYLNGTKRMDFPFSKGCFRNLQQFCCQSDAMCQRQRIWQPIAWQTPGACEKKQK